MCNWGALFDLMETKNYQNNTKNSNDVAEISWKYLSVRFSEDVVTLNQLQLRMYVSTGGEGQEILIMVTVYNLEAFCMVKKDFS